MRLYTFELTLAALVLVYGIVDDASTTRQNIILAK